MTVRPLVLTILWLITTHAYNVLPTRQRLATAAATVVTEVEHYNDFLPSPHPSLTAVDVVSACMNTLLLESRTAGLEVCFHFSSDRCRAAIGGSLEEFRNYSENPTFGFLIQCQAWEIVKVGDIISGTAHRGDMQTILMRATTRERNAPRAQSSMAAAASNDSAKQEEQEERRFLWTLQQERRPPLQDCWMVHEVLYVENAFFQTV